MSRPPLKRERAAHGLNLRLNGRLARPARQVVGPSAADLDRMVRAWRLRQQLDRLDPVARVPRGLVFDPRPALTSAVRKVSRAAAARVWHEPLGTHLVLDVLAGRERRIEAPPREVVDLGLDDLELEALALVDQLRPRTLPRPARRLAYRRLDGVVRPRRAVR